MREDKIVTFGTFTLTSTQWEYTVSTQKPLGFDFSIRGLFPASFNFTSGFVVIQQKPSPFIHLLYGNCVPSSFSLSGQLSASFPLCSPISFTWIPLMTPSTSLCAYWWHQLFLYMTAFGMLSSLHALKNAWWWLLCICFFI